VIDVAITAIVLGSDFGPGKSICEQQDKTRPMVDALGCALIPGALDRRTPAVYL
jgi:hypothetical protein